MEVQIFGAKKSADTRKAQRFFAERLRRRALGVQRAALGGGGA